LVRGGGRERQRTEAITAHVLVVYRCEQADQGSGCGADVAKGTQSFFFCCLGWLANNAGARAYHLLPKATPPASTADQHFRMRRDTVDDCGKLTLRHGSRPHHLGIGTAHAGTKVLVLATTTTVTVLATPNYQLIASHTIDPDHNYWRNKQKRPGRWPGKRVTDDATHV
jgi:hypothetical protein